MSAGARAHAAASDAGAEAGAPSADAAEVAVESARLRVVALDAARASAAYLRTAFRAPMRVENKADEYDLVTEHDLASEQILRREILAAVPDSRIIGEEGGGCGTGRVEWHVDPIDGTVNFASGIAFWCVSVAAAVDGRVVAGAIIEPMTGAEFSVDLQDGFRVNEVRVDAAGAAGEQIRATVICTFPRSLDVQANGDAALAAAGRMALEFGAVRAMGSGALGLAHVAAGWADATFDMHTNSWDVAAGSLMVEASGGRYVGIRNGEAVPDPSEHFRCRAYYAVGPGADYPCLSESVRELSADAAARHPVGG